MPTPDPGDQTAPALAVPESPGSTDRETAAREASEVLALLASVFVVAACGLVYELLIATVSSYLLGNSVTQFSLSVGLFVGSMGLGSWLSERLRHQLLTWFIGLELLLALVGGVSATCLYWAYSATPFYGGVLLAFLVIIGALVGLELPILVRLMHSYTRLRTAVARALSVDYLGSLVGSLLFPLILFPALGAGRTAFAVGLVNVGVALYTRAAFPHRFRGIFWPVAAGATAVLLTGGLLWADRLNGLFEQNLYDDRIILSRQTPFQRLVFTRWRDDFRLYLDGNLQFSSIDEHRYHETLIHPPMALTASRRHVLMLGGGDGLGLREVRKWPEVESITLVDLDPAMTDLARTFTPLRSLNGDAIRDPRVRIVNQDAYKFLDESRELWGAILIDLPDPNNDALARLYSREFYRLVRRHLSPGGVIATQASSPFFSREAFWCVVTTLRSAGLQVTPLHAYVPSFGDWGFILAAERPLDPTRAELPSGLRFLTRDLLPRLTIFEPDTSPMKVEVSTTDQPHILRYYLDGERRWGGS